MRAHPLWGLAVLLTLVGCPGEPEDTGVNPTDTDTDTDTDSDTDTDTDTDADTDTDTDTDVDTQPPECTAEPTTPTEPAAGMGSCYTAALECGQTYEHTLVGADNTWGADAYESGNWACAGHEGFGQDYSGGDRGYYFASPPGGATLTFASECDQIAFRTVQVADNDECPTSAHSIYCDSHNASSGTATWEAFPELNFLILVDGYDALEGAFSITVDCE